ncbi:TonB-dependent receptor [Nitrospirillum sp. BR 11164]|uniref:TonB-dependent receptor n=1 Tax=Nitrospirillum sp. BR 11164 TaxID=3104324 RepID=UPI002AFF7100|nr:TonB-dependent receptor [Nitrospirillum sp. BR 11164]MEA1652654.1 TonB-dependent receptor [Nitrospirillum sp. BR 11164]
MVKVTLQATSATMATAMALCLSASALAQSAPQPASDTLQDIVVTAERRTENLQDVAIAAMAISGDKLADKAVTRLSDLQFASPALTVTDAGLTQSVNIRGIGLASGSPQVANGVATYIDGLFQPPIVTTNSFYDIANVEVLRGPQGTLVGSNSTGGAMFITSKSPELDRVEGYGEVAYGNYATVATQGAINIPLTDTLAIRLAANHREHDSYYDDVGPYHNQPGGLNETDGRLGVLWRPGAFQALLKVEAANKNTGGYAYRPVPGTLYADAAVPGIRNLDYNAPTQNSERAIINSLELRYEFEDGITVRSLSGFQNKRINNLYDSDATEAATQTEQQYVREREWTEEVNILSPTDGAFNWIVGGYYQRNKIDVDILNENAGFPTNIGTKNNKLTTGVFAQGGYKITPDLELQVGARESWFHVTGDGGVYIGRGIPVFPANGLQVADTAGRHDDSMPTGKVALNWKPDADTLFYAFAARGYKPGGFNSSTSEFSPETVWDYEVGWKSTLLDGHLRTQLGAFYNDYKGFQFGRIDLTNGQNGVVNLADATIKGVEGQVQAKFGAFGADAGFAYVDSQLGSITVVDQRLLPPGTLGPQCPAGTASNPPVCFDYTGYLRTGGGGPNLFSPKWTGNAGVDYTIELPNGMTLTPRLNLAYVGPSYTDILYSRVTDYLAARTLLSALVTLRSGDWTVEAYATNLTDRKYVTGQSGNNEFYGAPREYGLRLHREF